MDYVNSFLTTDFHFYVLFFEHPVGESCNDGFHCKNAHNGNGHKLHYANDEVSVSTNNKIRIAHFFPEQNTFHDIA